MDDPIFLATTGDGVARAAPTAAGSWEISRSLEGLDVRALAVDPTDAGIAYAGTDCQGVWRTEDAGRNWTAVGLEGVSIRSLAVSPLRSGTVYAGVKPPGLHVSRDGGASWTELPGVRARRQFWWFTPAEPGAPYVQAIALSPTDPEVMLAGVEFGAVLRSEDGGETWSTHRKGALRDCHSLEFHAADGDWVYQAGGGGGAAVSRDAGKTFQRPRQGLDRRYGWAVGSDPQKPEVWYTSQAPGPGKAHGSGGAEAFIFRLSGGGSWEKLGGGLPQPLPHMPYALLTDPENPSLVYAGMSNGEIWRTENHGEEWGKLALNLGKIQRSLVFVREAGSGNGKPT